MVKSSKYVSATNLCTLLLELVPLDENIIVELLVPVHLLLHSLFIMSVVSRNAINLVKGKGAV